MRSYALAMTIAACTSFSVACSSPGRTAAWEKAAVSGGGTTTSTAVTNELSEKAKGLWAQRDDKAKLQEAIGVWEELVQKDPKNAEALTMLARANYFLADGFLALEGTAEEVEMKTYEKGADYGERALLVLEPEFEKAMRAETKFEDAMCADADAALAGKGCGKSTIGKAGIPAAYWYAVNLGRFASKQGLSARLYYKDKLKATMARIYELDQNFYYGAADRYFGAFFSILPSIAGKDLDASGRHFAKSIELAPEYIPTKVVKAQFLAIELDDEDMYRKLLQEVLAGDETENGDIAPEIRAAKRTAKKMLDEAEDKF